MASDTQPMQLPAGAVEGDLELVYRLPVEGWPRVIFRTNYRYDGGALWHDDVALVVARTREVLLHGARGATNDGTPLLVRLAQRDGADKLVVEAGGKPARVESDLQAPPSRSAWIHGLIGLGASAFGFLAGYLYLVKAQQLDSLWASKMGYHTAAWHALLTLTLFPASVWGQRLGIRAVQLVSLVFLFIHIGIALANAIWPDAGSANDAWIALLNALSGVGFLASVLYGQRAYRDMDPIAALREGRIG